jgi:hypothetical protein
VPHPARELLSVPDVCARYPALRLGGLRWQLFRRRENGLDRAVVRVGRRLLIDAAAFERWLDDQRERAS